MGTIQSLCPLGTAFDQDPKTVKMGSGSGSGGAIIPGGSSGSSPENLSGRKLGENSARSDMIRAIINRYGSMTPDGESQLSDRDANYILEAIGSPVETRRRR